MDKKTLNNELSQQEIREIIEMIEDKSYFHVIETIRDDARTFIRDKEDLDGCSASYYNVENDIDNTIEPAYENHKLNVGEYVIIFKNYGDGNIVDLKILKNSECSLPNENLQDELISAIQTIVNNEVFTLLEEIDKVEIDLSELPF